MCILPRCFIVSTLFLLNSAVAEAETGQRLSEQIEFDRGVVAVIGLPSDRAAEITEIAKRGLTVYFQSDDPEQCSSVREAADDAGLLGKRVFVDAGSSSTIHLANNLADRVLVGTTVSDPAVDNEVLRVLRSRATAQVGGRTLVKPLPEGIDEWSHPYHGPDNNPQSEDKWVRGRFHTQFLGYPKFSPMPEQTVIAGGRIFKAMGHIAHKANQNEMLNTLLCINAYNGTILWKRDLPDGFMIHRNTMIATQDALYLGDSESCKVIDATTGEVRSRLVADKSISDGPVWKWMAIRDNVLYALVGNTEIKVDTQKSARRGLGHWPWGMWKGHDYNDPKVSFGFGRTLVAIDLATNKQLWHYRDEQFLDARAVCMSGDQIFFYSPEQFLGCVGAEDGDLIWKNSDKDLLEAIGPNGRAQHYITGYATACYMKSTEDYLFFAGPQRKRLVAASARDGRLAWTYPTGNLQLVLRDDGVWASGPQNAQGGVRLDYKTGKVLAEFPARRACTRATGCADSIFYRATGGTVRVFTESNVAQHIDPMRPPCQDGVVISNGHLYWGPWMCGCELSLYGNICLTAMSTPVSEGQDVYADALVQAERFRDVLPLKTESGDWPTYRGDNARTDKTSHEIPASVKLAWSTRVTQGELPTAPVTAGGLIFVADRSGVVRALNSEGTTVWKRYTSGPVYFPPTVSHDRVYVGSADGRVYAFEARSGRDLWSFRVAPADRRIAVYGQLISRWPVAGGVVVAGDTVYAAAGISHYDGTYIVALDATTGELKRHNDQAGTLEAQVNNGISVQGNLTIVDGELRFLAGGVYETARFDLNSLKCLNTPKNQVSSQFRTAFYPYYPDYGKYVSLDSACADGCTLSHDASYEGSVFTNLALQRPLPAGVKKSRKEAARWIRRRGGEPPATVWQDNSNRRFTSFVLSSNHLVAAGHPDGHEDAFLVAIDLADGRDVWKKKLPALAVKGGSAIDAQRRIFVALENGQLLCFAPDGG